jgi:multidrug efflux pump subunit AcrA (membrane-fusion protein)
MRKRQWLIVLGVVAVLAVSLGLQRFFSSQKTLPQQIARQKQDVFVKAEKVIYDAVLTSIVASGRVNSQAEVDLSSEVQGRLLQGDILFKKGQSFRKGQILLKVFSEDISLQLKARKSGFLTSLANVLPDLRIDYPGAYPVWISFFNEININRMLPELPSIQNDKEKVFLASRGILAEYYAIRAEESRLGRYTIRAPFDGVLTQVFMEVGAVTNPGSRLASMIRTDMLEVEVPVDFREAAYISMGSPVVLKMKETGTEWTGMVGRKSAFVDPTTQSVPLFINLVSDHRQPVYQGQFLEVEFLDVVFENAFLIDRKAVFNKDQVYIIEDSVLRVLKAEVLHTGASEMVIRGLPDSIWVVTEPLINVTENSVVKILE